MTIAPQLPTCPDWCTADHEEQQRLNADSKFPQDRVPYHSVVLAEGHETESHGPLYSVVLDGADGEPVRLQVNLHTLTLGADQADVLSMALARGAQLLRDSEGANEVLLEGYWSGRNHVKFDYEELPATDAERALHD